MPDAVQLCPGSMRLLPVLRFRDDDKADCAYCNARPKSERRVTNAGRSLYYEIPVHRADGQRDPGKIDWSQVQ